MSDTELVRTECSCSTCQSWCRHVPGWFLPDEAERAAALKGLTIEDFFARFLTVDYWDADEPIYTLRPATTRETPGNVSGFNPLGACVFYIDGRCDIHAAKPYECATARCDAEVPADWHEQTGATWAPHQDTITRLFGYAPEQPECDAVDALSLLLGRW